MKELIIYFSEFFFFFFNFRYFQEYIYTTCIKKSFGRVLLIQDFSFKKHSFQHPALFRTVNFEYSRKISKRRLRSKHKFNRSPGAEKARDGTLSLSLSLFSSFPLITAIIVFHFISPSWHIHNRIRWRSSKGFNPAPSHVQYLQHCSAGLFINIESVEREGLKSTH